MTFGIGLSPDWSRIIGLRMFLLPRHRRLVLTVGLATWLVASAPTIWDACNRPPLTSVAKFGLWLGSFFVFGIAFWLTFMASRKANGGRVWKQQLTLIAIQTVAALLMVYLVPCYSIGIVLVVVAWEVALLLPVRFALLWIIVQTGFLAMILYGGVNSGLALFATNTSLAFQLFAFITASVARSEANARSELARTNTELRATRELLAESSRISERSRISDELHDVIGHNLTALNIHLEVAKHLAEGKALEHVRKSQSLAKILLQDVRDVVSAAGNDQIDMRRAVQALTEGLPYPNIHLSLAGDLRVEDSERAHTLLRCVQEIITNTLRHSGAQNLWLEVYRTDGGVEVRAKDDGRGAKSVQAGNGISAMRRRLERIGGRLRIESGLGNGFEVKAWMPLTGAVS
jgi:signal transduction histidine kinase